MKLLYDTIAITSRQKTVGFVNDKNQVKQNLV